MALRGTREADLIRVRRLVWMYLPSYKNWELLPKQKWATMRAQFLSELAQYWATCPCATVLFRPSSFCLANSAAITVTTSWDSICFIWPGLEDWWCSHIGDPNSITFSWNRPLRLSFFFLFQKLSDTSKFYPHSVTKCIALKKDQVCNVFRSISINLYRL
jgi:hypothetical protein